MSADPVRTEKAAAPDGRTLLVSGPGVDRMLRPGSVYRIGRDPAGDLVLNDPRVSWQHATLEHNGGGWLLADGDSTNGTYVRHTKVSRHVIAAEGEEIRLGHPDDGPALVFRAPAPPPQPPPAPQQRQAPAPPQYQQPAAPPQYQQPAAPPQYQQPAAPPQYQAPAPPYQGAPPQYQQPAAPPQQYEPAPQQYQQPAAPPQYQQPAAPQQYQQPPPAAPPQQYQPPAVPPYQGPVAPPYPQLQPGELASASSSLIGSGHSPSRIFSAPARAVRIGRNPDNDVVVNDLAVSRHHAELRRTGRGFEIVDLGSHNGTYLNGQLITAAPVTEVDQIGIGPATFCLVGDSLQEFVDTGDITLAASDLSFQIPSGKVLLDHISFALGERCLLGVIGPSGAGKSTLLGALTGMAPATSGTMLYDGRDLYQQYAQLRNRIGLVPQENILHTQLTPRRSLSYAAELRFSDTSKREREHRISEVIEELSLTRSADTRTSALSGGQQKRVNVALELLTKPSLLFLDEPTSGLDPGLDKSVMEMLAGLAHDGRTVIVVTHSVANLNLCDRLLVLVPGGKIGYFGPPADGLTHFGQPGWAEVFQAFEAQPGRDWAGEYRQSVYYSRYISAEMNALPPPLPPGRGSATAPPTRNKVAQLGTLTRRFLSVIGSDRMFLGVLAGLPLVLGLLVRVIPDSSGLVGPNNPNAESLLLVLAVGGSFSGAANAIWEIIKERSIYSRERAAGLSAGAYLLSKLLVLGVLSALQAVVLVAVGLIGRPLPATGAALTHLPLVELLIAVALLGVTSMTLGLLISSLINSTEKAIPLLVGIVMVQVVLAGGIFPLNGKIGLDQVSWLSPSRWGYAATAATSNLNKISPSQPGAASSADPLFNHTSGVWTRDVAILIVLALVFSLITWRRLAKLKPLRRR